MRLMRREGAPKRRRRIRKLRLLALLAVLGLVSSAAFSFGLVRAIASEVPKLEAANREKRELNGYIYAANGKTILAVLRGAESRVLVESDEIDALMKQAVVAIEDRRFWEHRGVDIRGILRAAWADIRRREVVEGGSTITQQFVKNVELRDERSIARKVREAALAWQLEQRWSKDKILTEYLNTIYFGNGAYGIQQAALVYFGHGAKELELHEAALLAGVAANPSRFDPVTNPRAAKARRRVVLRAMLEQKDITPSEYLAANGAPLPRGDDVRLPGTRGPAQYFVNYVTGQLIERYGEARVYGGGLRVRTTIDLELQRLAREAISEHLTGAEGPSAALVAIDPRDGSVKAMVGGNNYRKSQFNLAVQAQRQPGSAFKPFVLAAALRAGIAPATRFASEPTSINLGDKLWTVANYDDAYLGEADLETATVHSDNSVYAQLTQLVGPERIVRTARQLGVRSPLRAYYAIGLGVEEVNPLEMARAYATFATGGRRVDGTAFGNQPRVVVDVSDAQGEVVDENRPDGRPVLTPAQAAIVNAVLQRVVDEGTGERARLGDRPAAGKTGTTENYGDAWFVGYTPQLVVAVWVGYPTTLKPMLTEYDGRPVSGSTFPADIWKSFTESALRYMDAEPQWFPQPPSLYAAPKLVTWRGGQLRLDNGHCEERTEVVYFAGYGPRRTADCKPNEVEVPDVRGSTRSEAEERLAAQPLDPHVVFKPARTGQQPGVVVEQWPKRGYLSSFGKVTIVVTKPVHGIVPKLVGSTVRDARTKLRKLQLSPAITFSDGPAGKVVAQAPQPGVAAAPGLELRLVVGRG